MAELCGLRPVFTPLLLLLLLTCLNVWAQSGAEPGTSARWETRNGSLLPLPLISEED